MSVVLLTGAKGNLGSVVSRVLAGRGWTVAGVDRADGDLRVATDVQRMVDAIDQPLTGIVHLAGGITAGKRIEEHTSDDLQHMLSLNLVTTFNVLQAGIPRLKQAGGGSIITIGAQSVLHPVPDRAAYSAAKAAVIALTQSVAEEGRAHGIRANVIVPSIIDTPANREWGSPEDIARWITPEAIARTIADLLEPTNGISGAVIPMYGQLPY